MLTITTNNPIMGKKKINTTREEFNTKYYLL